MDLTILLGGHELTPLPAGALYDWELMTTALAAQKPWWTPGAKHGYHAMTFGYLVGELVRRISGSVNSPRAR